MPSEFQKALIAKFNQNIKDSSVRKNLAKIDKDNDKEQRESGYIDGMLDALHEIGEKM